MKVPFAPRGLRFGERVGVAFGACLLAIAALVTGVAARLDRAADDSHALLQAQESFAATGRMLAQAQASAIDNFSLLISPSEDQQRRLLQAVRQRNERLQAELQALDARLGDQPAIAQQLTELRTRLKGYERGAARIHTLVAQGKQSEAQFAADEEMMPMMVPFFASLQQLSDRLQEQVVLRQQAVAAVLDWTRSFALLLGAGVVLIAVAAGVWLVRSITRPLAEAIALAHRVRDGDLTTRSLHPGRDEASQLLQAMSDMSGGLSRLIGSVRDGAQSVAASSAQIAQGNADLSARTESQTAALQQTAASMEQLTSTVRSTADHSQSAHTLSGQASDDARQGHDAVGRMVGTMQEIAEASRRIGDIVGTIDALAFQTNLLALNAAVEAARAGEQGRGFAVVAAEVRSLANRSAQAGREIKALIADSMQRVQAGNGLASDAGASMTRILESVDRVAAIIAQISAAAREQAQGVEQVGVAIAQMDRATQQNASLVEQSAAAAEGLRQQSGQLAQAVHGFRVAAGA